jgi:hypothetical protein
MRRRGIPFLVVALLAFRGPSTGTLAQALGAIRGTVVDEETGAPLSGVRVATLESRAAAVTTSEGNFVLERIPSGSYTLTFSREGYQRQVRSNVVVTAGQMAEVSVALPREVVELDELVVAGEDILSGTEIEALELRAEAPTVQDSISAELIRKSGVSDVAGALKLVVGASITEGKYASVRGLSDRYTGTTLNGVRIPSADPRRRAVQLDLFPTGTVDSVTVTKTFTPDLQGEFTGGGIDIKTKAIPDEAIWSVGVASEYNTEATGNDAFLTYVGGGVDPDASDDGARDLPAEARKDPLPFPRFSANPSEADIESSQAYDDLVRSFAPAMGVTEEAPGVNYGFSLLGAKPIEFPGGKSLGLLGALTYTQKWDFYEDGVNNTAVVSGAGQEISVTRERTDSQGTDEVLIGGLATAVFKPHEDHELSLRYVVNLAADDAARFQVQETGETSVEQNQTLHYVERSVASLQAHGSHDLREVFGDSRIPGLKIDWMIADNRTSQNEPDVRFFRNVYDLTNMSMRFPQNSTDFQNTRRIFRNIDETNGQTGSNLIAPIRVWGDREGKLQGGILLDRTDRDYVQRSFTYTFPTQFGSIFNADRRENIAKAEFIATEPDDLWTDVFTNPENIGLATNTPPAPNQLLWTILPLGDDVDYVGDQEIDAAYVMGEVPLGSKVKVLGGVRVEKTEISIVPHNEAFGEVEVIVVLPSGDRAVQPVPEEEATADLSERDTLPAVSVTWEIVPRMRLRGSWSRTVARPTFRELAPVATEEFIFGDEFVGNPDLVLSRITNYDLRWEWLRDGGDVFAASVFYKSLRSPIEMISFSAANRSFIQPVNYDRGQIEGFELEARWSVGPVVSWLEGLVLGANYTRLDSEVDVPIEEQESLAAFGLAEETRRLQGQPDYVWNASVSYDRDSTGTSGGVFYTKMGTTLLTGPARGNEDGNPQVLQLPAATLDFTFSQRIRGGFSVLFKGANVLGETQHTVYETPSGEQADKVVRTRASRYTVGMSWKW